MKSLIFSILFLCFGASVWGAGQDFCPKHTRWGLPSTGPTLLCRTGYALSYNSRRKVPDWVAYHISRQQLSSRKARRSNDFRADADLPFSQRAELSDYKFSGYDRGHMAPAALMKWSRQAMSESFLLSNIVPQVGTGFNRGIWRNLESHIRKWVRLRGELYVITGPAYLGDNPKTLGKNGVAIPSHFYKVVFDPVRVEAIAFLLPHKRLSSRDLPRYITSIDKIEQATGLDFLQNLNKSQEIIVESTVQNNIWH